jgi:hypothetical protein
MPDAGTTFKIPPFMFKGGNLMSVDANEFLMSTGVRSASFDKIGAHVVGHIIRKPEVRQQRDFNTGEPLYWNDGNPRNQMVIVLMTDDQDPEDPEDSGERAIYARANMLAAIRAAVKAAHATGLEVGGKLSVQYHADGEQKKRGFNAPKLYRAKYQPPKDEPVPVPEEPQPAAQTRNGAQQQAAPVTDDDIPF